MSLLWTTVYNHWLDSDIIAKRDWALQYYCDFRLLYYMYMYIVDCDRDYEFWLKIFNNNSF